ncbi:ketopantoate reductase family protein [Clostridium saccharobutylicum]|uniref:2-dehydropantoate 2-reductase n=1 Tax=Clostridium saccharobutylicum DSM 13864 TaxID=1345695 RepID=U5MVA5_CLOSA|nr:2-dehydropantoate 2-reductase [Clostridium saccharobutylicum]AGX43576.1 2-dehydropantoate 2-reductase [Clostridium saccharobutylicum DSM 13864]AQR90874.1 2-dehydropantoate 2-reductase [Clostridium saccharobutylicum]AQS00778.1 2-dehydropantoate 2-reductase [Clostridium saccharobutylicum]AQS10440.1 2-dehydropantoate 2-reductase [Clostridium saccharobutylicum]AQS14761.1 2-dehydropantoate 2-reductase [Clostridium saccharobutylicum]
MKIGVIGIGATGGYISAMLCKSNENVYVISSGKTMNAIKNNGIILKNETNDKLVVYPKLVTDDASEAGIMDIVFVCVKEYSLKNAAKAISPMVDNHTLVIPIINGVDGGSKLYSYLGKGKVAEAAMYIVSKVESPGVIKCANKNRKIIISASKERKIYKKRLEEIYNILTKAEIICEVRKDAEVISWEKHMFNYAFNVTDSYYTSSSNKILDDEEKFNTFCNLAKECERVGRAKGINLSKNIYNTTINILMKLYSKNTAPVNNHMSVGKNFELQRFCEEVYRMGQEVGILTPYSKEAYNKLKIS